MPGQLVLGQYEIDRLLGEGSMGQVYLARQRDTHREVVVKVMNRETAAQPQFRQMFEREMQVMARFHHPHVVELLDASADDPDGPCIIMEYVPGIDLEEILRREGKLLPSRVGRLLGQLCSALQAAHAEGIIHRDLKPGNLMVMEAGSAQEVLKVMDFGLAQLTTSVYISLDKLKGDDATFAAGTAEYMAPEQVRGDVLDFRADLYSLGVMLFEMLTGKLPFSYETIPELLRAHLTEQPPTFAEVGAEDVVTQPIEVLVAQCLAKFPVERPRDAWEIAQRFERALGEPVLDGLPPPAEMKAHGFTHEPAPELAEKAPSDAIIHQFEAYMPEPIAVVKLRGFVQDVGGQLVDSAPGVLHVRLGGRDCRYQVPTGGMLSWVGLGGSQRINMELRMEKAAQGLSGQLSITLVLRMETKGKQPTDPRWKACCNRIHQDLRAYLMGK